jgi:hypothetical protein
MWNFNGQHKETRMNKPVIRKRIQQPESPFHMFCTGCSSAKVYAWSNLSEIASIPIDIDTKRLWLKSVASYMSCWRRWTLLKFSELNGSANTIDMHLLNTASFSIENHTK